MNDFYLLYSDACRFEEPMIEVGRSKLQQVVAKSEYQSIFRIPWGHHIYILSKCKNDIKKALFFIEKTLENNWSRAVLLNFLDTNLYEREGNAISNFTRALSDETSDLAQAITKDPYNFDFLTLRRVGGGPTNGLLICKTKDNVLAQYAAQSSNEPIGRAR